MILIDQSVDSSWFRLELAPGYFWKNWHDQHQTGTDRDIIQAFRSIATQSPLFNSNDMTDGADLFEVSFNGNSDYNTVRVAAWHEAPLISFATRYPWDISPLKISIVRMNPKTAVIVNESGEIQNFYDYSTFSNYLPTLLERHNALLSSGREIVNNFHDSYPGISLCGKAIQQLNNWSGSPTILNQVKQSLNRLNQFTNEWHNGIFKSYNCEFLRKLGLSFQVSDESESVKNSPRLRREREFWLPSGCKKFFKHHIKLSLGYRLHFYPDDESKKIYIGYIGPHLKL